MSTIYVKNGNWDEACATLKVNLDKRETHFSAQVAAALAKPGKPPEQQKARPAAEDPSRPGSSPVSSLSRPRLRG